MEKQQQRWDEYYTNKQETSDDKWLIKYGDVFDKLMPGKILDLGCGNGSNLQFLMTKSKDIYAFDYSEKAIDFLKKKYNVNATVSDIRNVMPYNDSFFNIVISDLSLHYFSEEETYKILNEINRIMKAQSILIARVNSINDINHGAGKGKELEKNYYENEGIKKRFFDKGMIEMMFGSIFDIIKMEEKKTIKYEDEKILWELTLAKRT